MCVKKKKVKQYIIYHLILCVITAVLWYVVMMVTERQMRFEIVEVEPYNRTATFNEVQDALGRVH